MPDNVSQPNPQERRTDEPPRVKIVAELPQDDEIQKNLEETIQNDGFPGSCGV
jgi:hypothetical protein